MCSQATHIYQQKSNQRIGNAWTVFFGSTLEKFKRSMSESNENNVVHKQF
jgi:hypothetical protein